MLLLDPRPRLNEGQYEAVNFWNQVQHFPVISLEPLPEIRVIQVERPARPRAEALRIVIEVVKRVIPYDHFADSRIVRGARQSVSQCSFLRVADFH